MLSAGRGDAAQRLWRDQQCLAAALGDPAGGQMCDAAGWVTKGPDAAGGAR